MSKIWLAAVIFVCLVSGCGGGGGGTHGAVTYSVSVLAVPPGATFQQAYMVDENDRAVGFILVNDSLRLCMWEADGELRLLRPPDEVASYVANKLWGSHTLPYLRMTSQDRIVYPATDPCVVDLQTGTTVCALPSLPGATRCIPADVNDAGLCVGSFESDDSWGGDPLPMMWSAGGVPKKLPLPAGCTGGEANSINDSGQIVGDAWGGDPNHYLPTPHVVVWNAGGSIIREIPLTPEQTSVGRKGLLISNNGYILTEGEFSFEIISPTGVVTLVSDPRGPCYMDVRAMNSCGQIVGNSEYGPLVFNPDGSTIFLPVPPGRVMCTAMDIGDDGVAVGCSGSEDASTAYAVRWTPN